MTKDYITGKCQLCKKPTTIHENVSIKGSTNGYDSETCEANDICWGCYATKIVPALREIGIEFKIESLVYCGG